MSDPGPLAPLPAPHYYMPPPPPVAVKPIARWIWIGTAVAVLAVIAATIPIYRVLRRQWRNADVIITSLHSRMIQGDDAAIFAESDLAYQDQVGLAKSNELFAYVRYHLGAPRSSTCIGQNISATTREGKILTLTFKTVFDNGTGTETLKMHESNGVYRLLGYHVDSPQLEQNAVPAALRPKD